METQKTILMSALFFLTYLLWSSWYDTFPERYKKENDPRIVREESIVPDVSGYKANASTTNVNTSTGNVGNNAGADVTKADLITVTTNVVEYKINPIGGDITNVKLLKYGKSDSDKTPVDLLNNNQETLYVAPNGLTGEFGPDKQNSRAVYTTAKLNYNTDILVNDSEKLKVDLLLNNTENNNVKIIKSFVFSKNNYDVDIEYQVINNDSKSWNGHVFSALKRKNTGSSASMFSPTAFTGLALYNTENKFHKISPDKLSNNPKVWDSSQGWAAIIQHYFISTWVPISDEMYQYSAKTNNDGTYSVNLLGPNFVVEPAQTVTKSIKFYSGPEQAEQLALLAPGLDRTVDYGILWPIASAIFWVMKKIYSFVGNWGYSIILVTILIKLVFYRLASSSYKSMAKLRVLGPKIEQLKQRYGDDREKMGKAMMELYKKEKVNPLGGCLPMLIQLPFFIALYWVLIESIELRQAPFVLWITDLSVKDPYFVLPLLMGISMFLQQKLSPAPADPTQAKVMMLMPVIFTVLFLYFPAGLVLYWVINTITSIMQQWWITRSVENDKSNKNNILSSKLDIKNIATTKKAMNDG